VSKAADDVSQECHSCLHQTACAWLELENGVLETLKNEIQPFQMFLWCPGEQYDVIQVREADLEVQSAQDEVHESLKLCRGVAQAERHCHEPEDVSS